MGWLSYLITEFYYTTFSSRKHNKSLHFYVLILKLKPVKIHRHHFVFDINIKTEKRDLSTIVFIAFEIVNRNKIIRKLITFFLQKKVVTNKPRFGSS